MKKKILLTFMFTIFNLNIAMASLSLKMGGWYSGGGEAPAINSLKMKFSLVGGGLGWSKSGVGTLTVSGGFINVAKTLPSSSPNLLYAYPVPFNPSLGHIKITFKGLSTLAKIEIYNLAGQKIKTLIKENSHDYYDWNVKTDNGRNLASGVYFYVINTGGQTKTGKLMIIK